MHPDHPRPPPRPPGAAPTCVPSRLSCTFVHTLQLRHSVLEGFHAALHAVCFFPVLPEGADLFVQLFQFFRLTVYHSLPNQRHQKGKPWLELCRRCAPTIRHQLVRKSSQPRASPTPALTRTSHQAPKRISVDTGTTGPHPRGGDQGTEKPHSPAPGHEAPHHSVLESQVQDPGATPISRGKVSVS